MSYPIEWYHFQPDLMWPNGTFYVFLIDISPTRNISDSGNVCSVLEKVKTNSELATGTVSSEHTG